MPNKIQTYDRIAELHYLNVVVEMIHDASGVRRHEESSFESKIEPKMKRNFLVGRIDEYTDNSKGQWVLGMKLGK